MFNPDPIALTRDVTVVRIPSGEKIILSATTEVVLTQTLGGSFTVAVPSTGSLVRIQSLDADALGLEVTDASTTVAKDATGSFDVEKVWEQLRNCYDPEIPVNIVDLGLIYSLEALDDEGGVGKRISVKMTLTAPGCGMGPTLGADAEQRILTVSGVARANVEIVWEPAWNPDRISEAGREKLGMV